jgi:ferrous iron transport protein A
MQQDGDNDFHSARQSVPGVLEMQTLAEVQEGTVVTIEDLSETDAVLRRRLYDMGVTEGARVRLCRRLPFGGPLMIECEELCIGLRRCDAPKIAVRRL